MSRSSVKCSPITISMFLVLVHWSVCSLTPNLPLWLGPSTAEAAHASYPDLEISILSNPPSSIPAGGSFSLTDTTLNSGTNTAGASTTEFRLSTDATITGSDTLIGSRSVDVLKKTASSNTSTAVTIPSNLPVGTYYLGACADAAGVVSESDETNNCRVSTTTVNVLAPIPFSANPAVIPAGGIVSVTWDQLSNAAVGDKLYLYPIGSSSYVDWRYLNCSQYVVPSSPITSGSCNVLIYNTLTPGNYEFRIASNGAWVASAGILVNSVEPVSKLAIITSGLNPFVGYDLSFHVQSQSVSGVPTNVSSDTGVSLSLKTGTGILSGTLTGVIPAGSYQVFIGPVQYTKAESGVVLTATRTSGDLLDPGDSSPITFDPGNPTTLSIITQPGTSQAGATIVGPPAIAFKDNFGNIVTSSASPITVEINSPNYGALYGTKTKNASAGVATFSDLRIDALGTYTLRASSSGFQTITSAPFDITTPLGGVTGTILNASGGAPIEGATVEALQSGIVKSSGVSAADGVYSIPNVPTGIFDIRTSAPGFLAQTQSGVEVLLGSTATANFSLSQERIVYVYDPLSRLKAVIDVSGQTATYAYDAVGNLLGISRYPSSQGSLIEFAPKSGAEGTAVTILGTGFSATPAQNSVTFNGIAATVLSSAPTQIVAEVPSGATTGPIGITTPSGSSTSADLFTVITSSSGGTPTLSGFSPVIGAVGTPVTVTGNNFDNSPSKNDLRFNISHGSISSASPTSLSTTVPTGTGSGQISVTTAWGKGTSNADFFIPPSPLTATHIEFTGRLAEATPLNVILNTSGKKGLLVFDGIAGHRVSLGVSNSTYPFPCPWCSNVVLTFYRPDGSSWVTTSWANSSSHYFEPPTLPMSGTYSILFDPVLVNPGDGTGQANLTLSHISGEDKGTIAMDSPIIVSVPIPGQNPWWTFTGTAGQRISLNITGANLPMACPWCQAAYVYIYKPDGQTLVSGTWANGTGIFIEPLELPVSGTYTLLLDPQGGGTGRATIGLYNVPPDDQGSISADGIPVFANLAVPGQKIIRSFAGTQNQIVSLHALNSTFGCGTGSVSIRAPDNSSLGSINFCNGQQFLEPVTLSETGTYSLRVDGSGPSTGQVTTTLYTVVDVTEAITVDGPPVTVNITTPGQRALLTFTATSGQLINIEGSNSTFPDQGFSCGISLTILSPSNAVLGPQGGSCSAQFSLGGYPLPTDGTYTLMVDPGVDGLGQVTLRLVSWPFLTLTYNGKIRDRVGQGDSYTGPAALNPDGALDGTFTVSSPAGSGQRTVTSLELRNSVYGYWNTVPDTFWVLGAASNFDAPFYNDSLGMVNFTLASGGSFSVFGSDYNNTHFNSGTVFYIVVTFSDGTQAGGSTVVP